MIDRAAMGTESTHAEPGADAVSASESHGPEAAAQAGADPRVSAKQPSQRRKIWFIVKLGASTALIAYILHTEDVAAITGALRGADLGLLAAAFLVYAATYYVRGLRWQILLEAGGVRAPLPFLIRAYLVSVFFSNFLPSTVGGDVVRVYASWKAGTTKTAALTVVFVDRFLGVVALLVFAAGAVLVVGSRIDLDLAVLGPFLLAGTLGAVAFLWLLFAPPQRLVERISAWQSAAPASLRRLLDPLLAAADAYRGKSRLLGVTILQSLFFQAMIIGHYVLIARALGIDVPLISFFWIIPVAVLIMMVPISINAIGVREHVFIFFFAGFGIAGAAAVAFAWASYAVVLVLGLIGGVIYAAFR